MEQIRFERIGEEMFHQVLDLSLIHIFRRSVPRDFSGHDHDDH